MPRTLRLTPSLLARLPERVEERGPIRWTVPDSFYADTTADILARLPPDGQLWVFAIGSLIWNPRFPYVERRRAVIRGWHRAFCLGPDMRFRGNPAAPGLMLTLDRGGQCKGVAFRMDPADLPTTLEELLRHEPPLPPSWVEARTAEGTVRAIAFTLPRSHPFHVKGLTEEEVADRIAIAVGFAGRMAEYVMHTVRHLEDEGIHDRALWRMQTLIADRLAALPERAPPPRALPPG